MNKHEINLLPLRFLGWINKVFEYGNAKHGEGTWRDHENARQRLIDKARRHIDAVERGDLMDESGQPHHAHAQADLMLVERIDFGDDE